MGLFTWLFSLDYEPGPWERIVACDDCETFYVPTLISPSIVVCWNCGGEMSQISGRMGRKDGHSYLIRREKK